MLVPESAVLAHPTRPADPAQSRREKFMPVVRVAAGNALEMYDFQIFGYYATAIAATFFPSGHEFASLMLALATFGAGFLMRPLGAIVLGAYIDHRGRRAGLLLTLALMGFGTLAVACLPGYAVLGIAAPLLVLVGRLVQGFSAGVELGGVWFTFQRSLHPIARASMSAGSPPASRWPSCSPHCLGLHSRRP